jgi:DNA-binding transcriptional MocR family regulator
MTGSGIRAAALADLLGHWPAAGGALYRLLANRIMRLADTGELPAGLRLPAERDLAGALSVSRNTVAAAYQMLRDEGMAESRQGAGTRIVPHRTTPAAVHRANGFFAGLLETSVVDVDLSIAAVDCAPQVAAALTDPAMLLDRSELRAVTGTSGYLPYGLPALRAAVASHLADRLGLPAGPSQVIVTTGGQQAMDLLIRSEVLPGQPVAVEDPTFPGVLDALHRAGARVLGLPAHDGLDLDRLEHVVRTHSPAMAYLIPTHHNPTGLVMPAGDRHRVARLAAAHPDTLFIDDMTLAELPLRDGPRPAPLAALSPQQPNLVSIGSLSKLYWGGLRTGWIRASPGLIGRVAATKAAADLGSAAFGQAIAAALLNGWHDDIVKWREQWLRARHDALASALRTHLPDWTWPEPDGGLSLWVRLPGPIDSGAFAQAALRNGIAVVPGRLLSATGQASEYIRLAFTQPPPTLTRSVLALARAATATRPRSAPTSA